MNMTSSRFLSLAVAGALLMAGCQANSDSTDNRDQDHSQETQEDIDQANEENADQVESSDEGGDDMADQLQQAIFDPTSQAILVNKQYSLDEDHYPDDLVPVDVPVVYESAEANQMRQEAAEALNQMFQAAEDQGIILYARSGFRSYQTQVDLFNNYANNHGLEAASRFSARAGESEHQTGLAMDITSESVDFDLVEAFGETEEGQWARDYAHEFGFIIRYLEGKEDITGYQYEPWHLRYLGEELASEVYESGLTYEEFLVEKGINIDI